MALHKLLHECSKQLNTLSLNRQPALPTRKLSRCIDVGLLHDMHYTRTARVYSLVQNKNT